MIYVVFRFIHASMAFFVVRFAMFWPLPSLGSVRLPKFHVDFHVDFFYFAQAHRKNTFRTSNGPIQVPRHASFRGTSFEPLQGTSLIHFEEPALGHFEEPYLSHFEEPDVSHFEEPVLIHFEEPWVTISRSHR